MKRILLSTFFALLLSSHFAAFSAGRASEAFVDAPKGIFPTLNRNTRLDMLDYFRSGSATASRNSLNSGSRILEESDNNLLVQLSDVSSCQISIIPFSGNDSIIALITTLNTPVPDSDLQFYDMHWLDIDKDLFAAPALKDWICAGCAVDIDEISNQTPFMLVSYSFDEATGILTLENNMEQYFSKEDFEKIGSCFVKRMQYKWTGKKMKRLK